MGVLQLSLAISWGHETMNNLSSHTASFLGGSTLAAAILGILTGQFHFDPTLATDWLIFAGAVMGGPVMAYLSVKARSDPALAAALAAISAMSSQNGNGAAVSTAPHQTVVTTPPTSPAVPPEPPPPTMEDHPA